jgi:hypothetical protein
MLKKYLILLTLAFTLGFSSGVYAQGRPCPNPGGSGPCNPPGAPIDSAIAVLLTLGVGYAIKKIRSHKE